MSAHTPLHEAATAVMADFDEETTGNTNLDNLINVAMAHKCDVNADLLAALDALINPPSIEENVILATHNYTCASLPGRSAFDASKCDGCTMSRARAAIAKARGK